MQPWDRAVTALRLLAIDPGLGGVVVRARSGPARDAFVQTARDIFGDPLRLHPQMTPDDLDDGIDLTATLNTGDLVQKQSLLQRNCATIQLTMAERATPYVVSKLTGMVDGVDSKVLIALDEGAAEDEAISPALADRLAFHVPLDDIALGDLTGTGHDNHAIRLTAVTMPADVAEQLVALSVRLGIHSLRAPYLALRCARAHAALHAREQVVGDDIAAAVALVLAHRATQMPQDDAPPPDAQDDPADQPEAPQDTDGLAIPDDILLEAVKAALPAGLLENLQNQTLNKGKGAGSGKKRVGNRRGRPLPARGNRATGNGRIDLMATLRAAIPWQTLRKRDDPTNPRAIILPADIRQKRYEETSDRLLIFTVDASGSAAVARLGEAKGAVEILLAEAYARRDHVALISFRGDAAEVVLPPTRSLVQTKRRLASLAGGGGTPLAAGMVAALEMANQAGKRGLTPTIVMLTDGRSNVALDGSGDRAQAALDVDKMGRSIAMARHDAIVIDTGKRPEQSLSLLARTLHAPYIALPRADAQTLSQAVSNSLDA